MTFICGKGVVVGQSVQTYNGWRVVTEVKENGIVLSDGTFVKYGDTVRGWKAAPRRKGKV